MPRKIKGLRMPSTVFLYVNVLRGEVGQPVFQPLYFAYTTDIHKCIYCWELRVCLQKMPTLRHRLTPNDLERGIRGVESPVLVFSGRYRDISGFTFTADRHFYFWLLTPFYFRLLPRCLTQSTYFRKNVNVILHLPTLYKLTCIGKFMYMQACLTCSIITVYACMVCPYLPWSTVTLWPWAWSYLSRPALCHQHSWH